MHHLTCVISSLLHSVNLIVFTLLLAHLILHISPHHSHHLRSHHLSLPRLRGGRVYLRRYMKCSTFTFFTFKGDTPPHTLSITCTRPVYPMIILAIRPYLSSYPTMLTTAALLGTNTRKNNLYKENPSVFPQNTKKTR